MKKKELAEALRLISCRSVQFLPIQIEYDRSEDVENIYSAIKQIEGDVCGPVKVRELVNKIQLDLLPKHDLLVISGSLYLLGEFLAEWNETVISVEIR